MMYPRVRVLAMAAAFGRRRPRTVLPRRAMVKRTLAVALGALNQSHRGTAQARTWKYILGPSATDLAVHVQFVRLDIPVEM